MSQADQVGRGARSRAAAPGGAGARAGAARAQRLAALIQTYQRTIIDTAALRFFPLLDPSGAMPAAGLPWFMAVFGRDSIIMSLQTLPFVPSSRRRRSRSWRRGRGARRRVPRRGARKMLHESRLGEMTAFTERRTLRTSGPPTARRCSSCSSTSTSGGRATRSSCVSSSQARLALRWIDEYGDRLGNGYV